MDVGTIETQILTGVASDYMTSEELTLVAEMENKISVLVEIGMSYQDVKNNLIRLH